MVEESPGTCVHNFFFIVLRFAAGKCQRNAERYSIHRNNKVLQQDHRNPSRQAGHFSEKTFRLQGWNVMFTKNHIIMCNQFFLCRWRWVNVIRKHPDTEERALESAWEMNACGNVCFKKNSLDFRHVHSHQLAHSIATLCISPKKEIHKNWFRVVFVPFAVMFDPTGIIKEKWYAVGQRQQKPRKLIGCRHGMHGGIKPHCVSRLENKCGLCFLGEP